MLLAASYLPAIASVSTTLQLKVHSSLSEVGQLWGIVHHISRGPGLRGWPLPTAASPDDRRTPSGSTLLRRRTFQLVTLVRAGSARHPKVLVLGGQQPSRPATRITGQRPFAAPTFGRRSRMGRVQVPHPAAASPPGSCPGGGGHQRRASPLRSGWSQERDRVPGVIFTAVPQACHSQRS